MIETSVLQLFTNFAFAPLFKAFYCHNQCFLPMKLGIQFVSNLQMIDFNNVIQSVASALYLHWANIILGYWQLSKRITFATLFMFCCSRIGSLHSCNSGHLSLIMAASLHWTFCCWISVGFIEAEHLQDTFSELYKHNNKKQIWKPNITRKAFV